MHREADALAEGLRVLGTREPLVPVMHALVLHQLSGPRGGLSALVASCGLSWGSPHRNCASHTCEFLSVLQFLAGGLQGPFLNVLTSPTAERREQSPPSSSRASPGALLQGQLPMGRSARAWTPNLKETKNRTVTRGAWGGLRDSYTALKP